jgi:hypothetical protein
MNKFVAVANFPLRDVTTGGGDGTWCGHPGRQSPRDDKRRGKTNISKENIIFSTLK